MPLANNKQKEQELIYFSKGWDLRSVTKQMLFLKLKVFVMIVTIETKACKIFQTNPSLLPWAVTTVLCIKAAPHSKFSTAHSFFLVICFQQWPQTGFL